MKWILLIIVIFWTQISFAQTTRNGRYAVITFEVTRTKSNHPKQSFYWITSIDSLMKSASLELSPLPMIPGDFSKDELRDCIKGNLIDIRSVSTTTDYDFEKGYKAEVKALFDMVKQRRVKVQTIRKDWFDGHKENVNVYITPVNGSFCNCLQNHIHDKKESWKGTLFLPVSGFKFDDTFWSSSIAKRLRFANYSYIEFSSYSVYYTKPGVTTDFKN